VVERAVDVEVALERGAAGDEPAGAAAPRPADPPQPRQQPAREPPRLRPQARIGGGGEIGEEGDRDVGVAGERRREGGLVEPPDLGRDGGELRVRGGEPVAAQRLPPLVGDPPPARRGAG